MLTQEGAEDSHSKTAANRLSRQTCFCYVHPVQSLMTTFVIHTSPEVPGKYSLARRHFSDGWAIIAVQALGNHQACNGVREMSPSHCVCVSNICLCYPAPTKCSLPSSVYVSAHSHNHIAIIWRCISQCHEVFYIGLGYVAIMGSINSNKEGHKESNSTTSK